MVLEPLMITQKLIMIAALIVLRRIASDSIFSDIDVLELHKLFVNTLAVKLYKQANQILAILSRAKHTIVHRLHLPTF